MDVRKDFGELESDYAFFEAHVDEIPNNTAALAPYLEERRGRVRLLDVGCGEGKFLVPLLERAGSPTDLEIALVEPFEGYRSRAVQAVRRFSRDVHAWPLMRDVPPDVRFDCVLSHHVLYYVNDLGETLDEMLRVVAPGGVMLIVMGAPDHPLPLLWQEAYRRLGVSVPFFQSIDLRAALESRGVTFQTCTVSNRLTFEDTRDNRERIVRFTFGQRIADVEMDLGLRWFDPYAVDGRIVMPHPDEVYVIRPS